MPVHIKFMELFSFIARKSRRLVQVLGTDYIEEHKRIKPGFRSVANLYRPQQTWQEFIGYKKQIFAGSLCGTDDIYMFFQNQTHLRGNTFRLVCCREAAFQQYLYVPSSRGGGAFSP